MKKKKKIKKKKLPKHRDMATLALILSGKGGSHGNKKSENRKKRKNIKKSLKNIEGF
jgi:hypothetical protein